MLAKEALKQEASDNEAAIKAARREAEKAKLEAEVAAATAKRMKDQAEAEAEEAAREAAVVRLKKKPAIFAK